ncbi:lysostaphin resistance A-like protein [Sporosarcina sp. OR05]|uniref:CPBP family intramembrane glutamic endopeptidase n=1 Tax=Sporosarcina sp. OR05 TaxID=2969819 RepID=UPI00352AF35B
MIWSILFHRIVTILIFFPGIFYLLFDKTIIVQKGTTDKFVYALLSSIFLSFLFVRDMRILLLICLCIAIPSMQVILELKSVKYFFKACKEKKFLLQTLILIPILEEYIFRFVMYELLTAHEIPPLFYITFSSLTFTFIHYFQLKAKSYYKLIVGIMLATVYVYTTNLFVVILMHVLFNVLVYLFKYTHHYKGFQT